MTLRVIDLFSGIGGFALAADWVGGFETIQFVEREPFCQKILSQHWPSVPIHDDVCTYNPTIGIADVVCGGFPCQDISLAGKQVGIKVGTRSGLFYELLRVVCAVRPRFVVLENVAAITSNGLGTVLGELAKAGYDTEWACIPASAVGACHRRDRWWCIAYAQGGRWGAWPGQGQGQARHEGPGAGDGAAGFAADATGKQRNDMRAARPGGQAESESGDGDRADAANTIGVRCQRRGATGDMASQARACEADSQQRQRNGDPVDDCGAVIAYANHKGLQRQREQLELQQSGRQKTPSWSCQSRMPESDWRCFVSQPVIRRGDDGFSGRVDRLKALGNAVVPQVAMIPLARVLALASADSK